MKTRVLQTVLITIFCLNAIAIFATTYTYETVSGVTGWRGGAAPISPLPANDFIVIDANYMWGTFGYASSGTITVNAGKQLKFVNTFINNGTVVNNGTLITAFESSGYEGMQNTGTFTNNVGGSLQINGDAALFSNQNGGIFNNYGTLTNNFQFNNQLGGTFNNYSVCSSPNSVGTIINRGTINIPGANATMSYYCAFVNEGTINVSTGGKLAIGSSTLLTGGTINWSNGGIIALRAGLQITSGTNFIIPLGGTLILSENNNAMNLQILSGGTITNNGILQVNTAASLMVMSGGNLINNNTATFLRGVSVSSGGSFTNNSGATLTGDGGVYGTGTITNAGTFTNTSVGVYGGVFNNSGTMTDGFLQVNNLTTINNTGTITMNLATARYVFNANPVVFPNGSFNWNAGTIEVGQPGVLTLNSDMTLNSSKILNIMGRLIIANGTSLNINFNSKLALGSNGVVTNNGTINNYGVIDNAGTIDNTSGTISLLSSGGNQSVLYLKNASSSTLPNGTFNWNSGTVGLVQSSMTVNNSLTIPANAAFQSQGSVFTIGTTGTVTNNGSFNSFGGGSMTNNGTFMNNGVTEVNTVTNNGIFVNNESVFSYGTRYFQNNSNGTVKGFGTFNNTYLANGGILAPGSSPGCLRFMGNTTIDYSGTTQIEINGTTVCSQFDQVVLQAVVNVGGILNVSFGYTPAVGSTFQIFRNATTSIYTGVFTSINVTPNTVSVTYNSSNGNIVVNSTALPVDLLSFTATNNGSRAQLNWQTATENEVKNFDIEKSADGRKFEKIAEVEAHNTPSVYSAFDDYFFESAYYRLKINDLDGKVAYSKTISLEKNASKNLKIYPNPATHILTIENAKGKTLEIVNALGQVVVNQSNNESTTIDIQSLPNGIYFLKAANQSVRFIKN